MFHPNRNHSKFTVLLAPDFIDDTQKSSKNRPKITKDSGLLFVEKEHKSKFILSFCPDKTLVSFVIVDHCCFPRPRRGKQQSHSAPCYSADGIGNIGVRLQFLQVFFRQFFIIFLKFIILPCLYFVKQKY